MSVWGWIGAVSIVAGTAFSALDGEWLRVAVWMVAGTWFVIAQLEMDTARQWEETAKNLERLFRAESAARRRLVLAEKGRAVVPMQRKPEVPVEKGVLFFARSRWGWRSRRFYFAVINHAEHRPLFSERHGRQPFRKVRVGRWCIHVRIGERL